MAGFRIVNTDHTGITVSDLDRSIAFYRDVLGFKVSEKSRHGGKFFDDVTGVKGAEIDIAYVEAPGHQIELLCYRSPKDRVCSDLRPCDPGFLHLAFLVENIEAVVKAIERAGFAPMTKPVPTVPDGDRKGWKAIYTRDPDGVVLEFMQMPKP